MAHKTNAARILDRMKIVYELKEFQIDLEDLSAAHAAELIGIPADEIYKTIVLRGNPMPYFVAVLPSGQQIDLKKAAKATENKNAELVHVKELKDLTGYIRGGCSPVGMKKLFPTVIDSSAKSRGRIFVSAGKRGLLMHLKPEDLLKACGGRYGEIVLENEEPGVRRD